MDKNLEKYPLWEHQKLGVDSAKEKSCFYFAWDLGVGKTRVALELLKYHFNKDQRIQKTLILCPPILISNWLAELRKYTNIDSSRITALRGSGKDRLFIFDRAIKKDHDSIIICNYECLTNSDLFVAIRNWKPTFLVCDELHKAKNPKAKRTKRLIELSKVTKVRYGLSGTPLLNSVIDLYSQYLILDSGKTFGKSFYAFRARFLYDANANAPKHVNFPNWKLRSGALEELNKL